MKHLIILIISLAYLNSYSQENDSLDVEYDYNNRSFISGWVSDNSSIKVHYGNAYCDLSNLNSNFKNQYGSTLDDELFLLGFSFEEMFMTGREGYFDGHLTYQFILPKSYDFSDTINYKLLGFQLGMDYGKDLFPECQPFDLLIGIGFNTGRLRLLQKDIRIENKYLTYANPFLSPKIRIEPKIVIKRIVFSIKLEYMYDISNPNWNVKDSRLSTIGTSKSTGYSVQLSLGWLKI